MNDLSIYIHIPFCKSKCGYCDFLSFAAGTGDCPPSLGTAPGNYVSALCNDIEASAAAFSEHRVVTVFFGGGTPSLLSIEQLDRIISTLQQHFAFTQMSIEANPDTVSKNYLAQLKQLGFSRISFGVQSFSDRCLEAIGRTHDAAAAKNAVKWAHEAGFDDINLDLMFALPSQSLEDFEQSLDMAAKLPITHISCYALTIEEGTAMQDFLTDESSDRQMYALAKQKLAAAGFEHYELSNWAKAGYKCQHNIGYWTGRKYLGLGLGASSYFDNKRLKKTDTLGAYVSGDFGFILQEELSHDAQMGEFMFLGLRMLEGISISGFETRFEKSVFNVFGAEILRLSKDGLLEQDGDKIRLTMRGLDIANVVFVEFLR